MRRVILRRGEASFEVAHNVQRPFVVSAEGLDVRAVGTAFVVGIEDGGVEVTVAEGVVAVGGAASGSPRPRYIRRNEQFVAAQTGPRKAARHSAAIQRRGAGSKGLLGLNGPELRDQDRSVSRSHDQQGGTPGGHADGAR